MPNMNGDLAAIQIRKKLGLDLPIIALTGDAVEGIKGICAQAGINAFFTKPVDKQSLFVEVHKLLLERKRLNGLHESMDFPSEGGRKGNSCRESSCAN